MKKLSYLFLFTASVLGKAIGQQTEPVKKTVFIIVDGVSADVIEKMATPNLQAIKKAGGYTRAYVGGVKGTYSETPTISAVGYNSVLTGTWVNKHNVWDNDIAEPNYHYPTIFRLLKEQYPQKKTAIYSTWLDNRTKLVGDNLAETGNLPIDYHYDGMEFDTVNFPHDKKGQYLNKIDEAVAQKAAEGIKTNAPDLSWVYLEFTDDMGHAHGDSPEFHDAVKAADKRVGYIWDAIQHRQKQFNEEWLLIVTTDHGRDAKKGSGHGGQTDRERSGWIFTNAHKLNEAFQAPQASIVDIMPTIARFMGLKASEADAFEVDGYPLIGQLSFTNARFDQKDSTLIISWHPLETGGEVNIWVSPSNQYKNGGKDSYQLLGNAPLAAGSTVMKLPASNTLFYKIVLQARLNNANGWTGNIAGKKGDSGD